MTIQQLFNSVDPRVRMIWNQQTTQLSKEMNYREIGLTDRNAEIKNTQIQNFSGLGLAVQTAESQPYFKEDILQTVNTTITPVKYTNSMNITEEQLRFNLWPEINNATADLANSVYGRVDQNAAKMLYLGFGTTFSSMGNGEALFSTTHAMADGTQQSNSLGTVALSYDNLKTALQNIDRFYDDKGIQLQPCRKLRLIVARENKERAQEVLRSIGNPDSADRITNVFNTSYKGYIDYAVADWIPTGFKKYWFVLDMARASRMFWMMWGWRPRFDSDNLPTNGSKVYTASVNFQPGFSSFQHIIGSAATT